MKHLAARIREHAARLPTGAVFGAKGLLHLGSRAGLDQALSRLTRGGELLRVGRGLYTRPVEGRFGKRAPTAHEFVTSLASQRGETIVAGGAASANTLGLTRHVPVRPVYLTTGRSRKIRLGEQAIELNKAPTWLFTLGNRPGGEVLRALAWLGPAQAPAAMVELKRRLPAEVLEELASVCHLFPTWLAELICKAATDD